MSCARSSAGSTCPATSPPPRTVHARLGAALALLQALAWAHCRDALAARSRSSALGSSSSTDPPACQDNLTSDRYEPDVREEVARTFACGGPRPASRAFGRAAEPGANLCLHTQRERAQIVLGEQSQVVA